MRKAAIISAAFVVAFLAGVVAYDVRNPSVAEASNVGSSSNLGAYSGNVGISGNLGVTGTITTTRGISAVTGVFSGAVTMGGASTGDRLTLTSTSGTALTATGQGAFTAITGTAGAASGLGGTFTNTLNGYAIRITGDTTSPTAASIRMDTLDTNPSAAASFGDLFTLLSGSTLALRMATATTPRWDDVGSFLSVTTGFTAHAGGGQGSATAICTTPFSTVGTVVTGADSVILPTTPILGKICEIKNKGANAMALFPASGASLCVDGAGCLAGNASTSVAANASIRCWSESSTVWNCR
jgi:hypothetical protein